MKPEPPTGGASLDGLTTFSLSEETQIPKGRLEPPKAWFIWSL